MHTCIYRKRATIQETPVMIHIMATGSTSTANIIMAAGSTSTANITTDIRIPIQRRAVLSQSTNTSTNNDTNATITSNLICASSCCSCCCYKLTYRGLVVTDLPVDLHGIVSEHDFEEFCCTMNGYINQYDAILKRRWELVIVLFFISFLAFVFIDDIFFDPYGTGQDTMWTMIHSILHIWVGTAIFVGMHYLNTSFFFKKEIQQVMDEQNDMYRNAVATCTDMSQRVTLTLPSSSPVLDVTCSLGSKSCKDWIGSYNNMDYIEFTTTTAFENTGDSCTGAEPERKLVVTTKEDDQASSK